jgi:tetratricopeptide (TPR) repeat protein
VPPTPGSLGERFLRNNGRIVATGAIGLVVLFVALHSMDDPEGDGRGFRRQRARLALAWSIVEDDGRGRREALRRLGQVGMPAAERAWLEDPAGAARDGRDQPAGPLFDGLARFGAGDVAGARTSWIPAARADVQDPLAAAWLAVAASEAGWDEGEGILEDLGRLRPACPFILLARARVLVCAGEWERAEGLFAKLVANSPDRGSLRHAWADSRMRSGDGPGAREVMASWLALQPLDALGWLWLAEAQVAAAQLERAKESYRRVLGILPDHDAARSALLRLDGGR